MNTAANTTTTNHASLAAIKAELQGLAWLARIMPETPQEASALLSERLGVLANDVDAAMVMEARRARRGADFSE